MASTPSSATDPRQRSILAVASGGGHWIQLMRLRQAFAGCRVTFATTDAAFAHELGQPVHVLPDGNSTRKIATLVMFIKAAWLVVWLRPDVVITTGAAPGLACLMVAKLLRRRTIWIDSLANSEKLSRSGAMAKRWSDLWLTQWPELAKPDGPACWGAVL